MLRCAVLRCAADFIYSEYLTEAGSEFRRVVWQIAEDYASEVFFLFSCFFFFLLHIASELLIRLVIGLWTSLQRSCSSLPDRPAAAAFPLPAAPLGQLCAWRCCSADPRGLGLASLSALPPPGAVKLLRLPGYVPMPAFREAVDVPLVVRKARRPKEEVRVHGRSPMSPRFLWYCADPCILFAHESAEPTAGTDCLLPA